jgi:glycerol-3-phosphate dehydrogenase (NAD(P)+)
MGIAFGVGIHESRGGAPGSVALHNYESAVFAQAIVEMQRLVIALGGRAETVAGLAGVGDLDVTCNGGRTGRFGRLLGLGHPLAEAIAKMEGATLECLDILSVMRSAAPWLESALGVKWSDLPLLEHLAAVALDGAPVKMPFDRFFGR